MERHQLYHSNTLMGQEVVKRARADVTRLNIGRRDSGLPLYPQVSCCWMVHPFKLDSKLHKSILRRNYSLLDECPPGSVRAEWFPPHRDIYIPRDC